MTAHIPTRRESATTSRSARTHTHTHRRRRQSMMKEWNGRPDGAVGRKKRPASRKTRSAR